MSESRSGRFSPKRALMYWCRIGKIAGGTKPERFAELAIRKWPELSAFRVANGYDYEGLARKVELIVRFERKMHAQSKSRAAEAQFLRDRGLI